jgi:superfamily I DNA/RNA helicase/RecB family exonuclease
VPKITLSLFQLEREQSALVIGCPGSGKTQSLVELVQELEAQGATPQEILVLSPSRMSANSLRDLIAARSAQAALKPRARSLSSFAFELVSKNRPDLKLLSGAAQQALVAQLIESSVATKQHLSWKVDALTASLQGFQSEVRDLLSVLIENQLDSQAVSLLQKQYPGLRLQVAMDLMPLYSQRISELGALDPSELLVAALTEVSAAAKPRYLLVDDAQDLSPAALELVRQISNQSVSFIFGDPDAAVLGFRSGAESFVSLATAEFQRINLAAPDFSEQKLNLMARVSSRIPTALATAQRPRTLSDLGYTAQLFDNQSAEVDWLAASLRRARLIDEVGWDQMAVVCRTRTQLDQLAADLTARSVPVRILGVQRALRDQPAARAILDFGSLCFGLDANLDREPLLQSGLVGLDALGVRRLFRELSAQPDQEMRSRRVLAKELFEELLESDSFEAKRINRLTQQRFRVANQDSLSAYQFVSLAAELFNTERLRTLSRGRSQVALAANRELDSLLELFAAANRFDLREGGPASAFVLDQLQRAIPEDSLAPIGKKPAVTLATSAQLGGASFEIVAIPRLQEGIWPNLKPRNSLLGANNLQSYLLGRSESPTSPAGNELGDEIRLFYKAIGSHRGNLLLSAMSSSQEQPSQFFRMFGIALVREEHELDFDIRRKVGRLRKSAIAKDQSAIATLSALSLAGVPGANPKNWQGLLEPSGVDPVVLAGEQHRLSASSLEAFEKCPLHWFIGTFGGNASNFQASIGTLLHAGLEATASGSDLAEFVSSNWHTLEFESQWQSLAQLRRVSKMVAMVAQYLDQSAELVAAEQKFELEVGSLTVAGKIDRIEKDASGTWVVDLKTGRPPSQKEVLDNRQLALYQLALSNQGDQLAGARIVSVGGEALKVLEQPALNQASKAELQTLLDRAATEIGSDTFQASISDHCSQDGNCQLLLAKAVQHG